MRVTRIEVEGLWGRFHHVVDLNQKGHLTVLHGPNGFGKTALLRLADTFLTRPFAALSASLFDRVSLFFDNGLDVHATRAQSADGARDISVRMYLGDSFKSVSISETLGEALGNFDVKLPELRPLDAAQLPRARFSQGNEQPAAQGMGLPLRSLQEARKRYVEIANTLAARFPARLLGSTEEKTLSSDQLCDKLREIARQRAELETLGILDQDPARVAALAGEIQGETQLRALSIFAHDEEQKLAVFDGIVEKLRLLRRIVNERFRFKELVLDSDRGVEIRGDDGKILPVAALSSGEQRMLSLCCELLFETPTNTLFLLDEPENSLHVSWQSGFVRDLIEILRLTGCDLLMATHSPQIIAERQELTVELKGPSPSAP